VSLEGPTVTLRELRREDYPMLVRLRNDMETQGWSRTLPPDYTLGMYEKRFEAREFSYRRDSAVFVIEDRATGMPVGFCNYGDVVDRLEATIGIAVEREHWGTGQSAEAIEVLLGFLFLELGLRVVRLWTQSGNLRAVGSAEKHGFRTAARFREAVYKGGAYRDNLSMDLLREEWFGLHPEHTDELEDPFAG
jgi:RimJ/RimL family protein N-acetyltransferase